VVIETSIQLAIVAGGISLGYVLFGVFLLSKYDEIGVESLAGFAILWGASFFVQSVIIYVFATYGITDGSQLVQLQTSVASSVQSTLVGADLLANLLKIGGIFMWLWFVLRYTRRIDRQEKLVLAGVGGITFLIVMANGLLGAFDAFGVIAIEATLRSNLHQFGAVIEILGTGVAIGIGIALLYETAVNHRPFNKAAVVGLSVPIIFLWLLGYLYQFGLVTDFQSIGVLRIIFLSLGLIGLWSSITKYELFNQLPASRSVGRQTAFESSDTAIVVANNADNVSDLNHAAQELFAASSLDCIGNPLDDLLPETIDSGEFRESTPVVFRMPNSDRVIEAVMTTATDDDGNQIGRTVVFTDITTERRRQQRIQVLNRVLRHNLRNDLNAAKGYVGVMADGGSGTKTYQQTVERLLDDLVIIGKKAQRTEEVLEAEPLSESSTRLGLLIKDAIDSVKSEYDHLEISGSVPVSVAVRINPAVIGSVIQEVIENAVRHTDSEITISYDEASTTLTIADNGPGIPDHEIATIDSAQETDLQHGSGLGLWLVKWGTDSFGGRTTFETDETGTTVHISIPEDLIEELD